MAKDWPSEDSRKWYLERLQANSEEWRTLGDMIAKAQDDAVCAKTYLGFAGHESVKQGAEILRADLGYEHSSPVESLLIDHAVLSYVRLGLAEVKYSWVMRRSHRFDEGAFNEMKLTQAQRRFTRSIESLARVRRMLSQVRTPVAVEGGPLRAIAKG
jgi:hypothetical protein